MAGIDLDAEIREYQWRRKFEDEPSRALRVPLIATILLIIVSVIAHSLFLH